MSRRVRVNDGFDGIALPDGEVYNGPIEVVLTDKEWRRVSQDTIDEGIVTDLGAVADPEFDALTVNAASDLDDYLVGDEYVLPAGLVILNGALDLGDKALRLSTDTVLPGFADASITSTVAGGVVRATNIGSHLIMREFSIIATGGPCLNLTGTIDYQANLFFIGLFGVSAGTITGFDVQALKDCFTNCPDGLIFDGTVNKLFVSQCPFYGITGSAITLAATFSATVVDIVTSFFKFDDPGVCITAEAGYTVGEGLLRGSLIAGTATPLVGLAPSDVEWRMVENSGIRDSRIVGSFALSATAETVIAAVNTPVKVAGTTTGGLLNERFTHTDNRLTYVGNAPALLKLNGVLAVDASNNTSLEFYIAKNGAVIGESFSRIRVGVGGERQGSVQVIAEAEPNDYFEIWVANLTDASNLTCLTLNLSAST